MQFEFVEISKISLNPKNPRTISKQNLLKLVKSIKAAPWMLEIRPLVLNDVGEVLGGNMRLKACIEAGLTQVPVIWAKNLTAAQQREFIIKDNVGFGDWDEAALRTEWELEELADWGLELTPVDILGTEDDFDAEGALPASAPEIVPGDVFQIGPHRLVCGDSTRVEYVDLCLGEAKPALMITDPPYGVDYDPEWRQGWGLEQGKQRAEGKVANDHEASWSESWALSPAIIAYVYHASKFSNVVFNDLENCQFLIRTQIIWAKNHQVLSRRGYHTKHEPCWYAVKKGATAHWIGDRKQTTLWEIDKPPKSETGHSTQKPVECMLRPMRNHAGNVYDPFIGSGTTMVAAEQLGRVCYGIEIDPRYCAVIIARMRALVPGIEVFKNGELFG